MVAQLLPLRGVRILDLSRLLPGPYATWLLGRLGAEIVRVEAVGLVDYSRAFPPYVAGEAALFHVINRGKRSIAIDLKRPEGRQVLLRLAATSDVLFEQFRPGVLDRLGLPLPVLRQSRPELIVARLTGYGQSGPLRDRAGHDLNYQALAGSLWLSGPPDGPPPVPPVPTADLSGALHAVIAIQGALLHRALGGGGSELDISMTDAVASLAAPLVAAWTGAGGEAPGRGDGDLSGGLAQYRVYPCRGGGYLAVGALEPKFWATFADAAGHPEWAQEPAVRGPHQAALTEAVGAAVRERTLPQWQELLAPLDCCVSAVLDPGQGLDHPHFAARGLLGTAPSTGGLARWCEPWPGGSEAAVPAHGQDTGALLGEVGYDEAAIEGLRRVGAVE